MMIRRYFSNKIRDAVDNYYYHNPDTLMPLLMLALAAKGKLSISVGTNKPDAFACVLSPKEIINYDWVSYNIALKRRVNKWIKDGVTIVAAEMELGRSLLQVFNTIKRHDEKDVVQEYHHRIGRLVHHSSNEASEKAQRQYATLVLSEALLNTQTSLKSQYLLIFNYILEKSGLQPKRPRLDVARTLSILLQYDGKGLVYNPFAGCSIAGAMLKSKENFYGDGDSNEKVYSAGLLLNYGLGISNEHFIQRDSTQWLIGKKIDYVISTYTGFINGESAFDFCLGKCLDDSDFKGRYAGMVPPKEIFEKQTANFKEALKRDWIESIVLLPFGEAAVLINAEKANEQKKQIKFANLTHPMLGNRPVGISLFNDCTDILKVSDVKKKGFLRSLVIPEIDELDNYEIIKLSSIVSKVKRKTFNLDNFPVEERVLASIDKSQNYDQFNLAWMQGIHKKQRTSLFSPAYHIEQDSLITNDRGYLEPRLFDVEDGTAFFQDGYVFTFNDPKHVDTFWLIRELNAPYVQRQLHPYGVDQMVPEFITEDQILNLQLYHDKDEGFVFDDLETSDDAIDPDADKLKTGFVLKGEKNKYTIHDFLGHGYFGYTYSALSENLVTGEKKEIVLKEFYPYRYYKREGVRAVLKDEEDRTMIEENKNKFVEEAKIMNHLGHIPDSHIVPADEVFSNEETDTTYYCMPFYQDGSLEDLQMSGFNFTEELLIKRIVTPLCKALHVAHNAKVLHLDIKPENILVDEDGDAVLIDFGVAKQYDKKGDIINREGLSSVSIFAAPELKHGNMVKFGPQTDIYGLASSLFYLIAAPTEPHPIVDFSDQDKDLRMSLSKAKCSDGFINAIIAGLQFSATSRPKDSQAFLNLFPGCEDIKLD